MDLTAAASSIAHGLLVSTAAIWVVLELRQSFKRRSDAMKANWASEVVFRLGIGVGVVMATVLPLAAPAANIPSALAVWIGLGLLWCGVGLRFWSFRTLGQYFTVVVQTSGEQPVITDGPYAVIRHPSYAGLLLALIGVGLCIGNWWSLICATVAVTASLVFRIHVEEQALLRDLGNDYRGYAATHKRLIPFVW